MRIAHLHACSAPPETPAAACPSPTQFYTIAVETPEGDMALMDAVMEGERARRQAEGTCD